MMTADAVVRKLTAMYMMLAVEQVLHEHKLASDDHIEIIEHPTRLIQCILESTHDDSSERGNYHCITCSQVFTLLFNTSILRTSVGVAPSTDMLKGTTSTLANLFNSSSRSIDLTQHWLVDFFVIFMHCGQHEEDIPDWLF